MVTHLIIRKCGKFHYIIYRIDKITLLLVIAIRNSADETLNALKRQKLHCL